MALTIADKAKVYPGRFCRHCDYSLSQLTANRCPECGREFDPADPRTTSARPNRRRTRLLRKWGIIIAIGMPLVIYAIIFVKIPCGFGYGQICTDCAVVENVDEQRAPIFGFTFRKTRTQSATLLSAVLARNGIRQGNIHHWVFCTGGDYGLTWSCALGSGRYLFDAANKPAVAVFADALCKYDDTTTRDHWLDRVMDPLRARQLGRAIEDSGPPISGFADRASFEKWWDQNVADFEKAVTP